MNPSTNFVFDLGGLAQTFSRRGVARTLNEQMVLLVHTLPSVEEFHESPADGQNE